MYLQTGRVVYSLMQVSTAGSKWLVAIHVEESYTPNSTQLALWSGLKYLHVKAMTDTMRSGRDTGQSCTDNSNFRSAKSLTWNWRCGREESINKQLPYLVDKDEGMKNWVFKLHLNGAEPSAQRDRKSIIVQSIDTGHKFLGVAEMLEAIYKEKKNRAGCAVPRCDVCLLRHGEA
jgi:hypothetical protein